VAAAVAAAHRQRAPAEIRRRPSNGSRRRGLLPPL
jgi:hypothetical protein